MFLKDKDDVISVSPPNIGWLEKTLSKNEVDYLWRCVENKSKNSHKKELVGVICESNELNDNGNWFWENTLKYLIQRYTNKFGNIGEDVPVNQMHPYYLKSWWVNIQKQNEFNPLHSHSGVYSFVIWLKIPTNWKEQNDNPISKFSKGNYISTFQFTYLDILGKIRSYDYHLSEKDDGKMLFFPSKLSHQVYPFFNCVEDRISISGNIFLNSARTM